MNRPVRRGRTKAAATAYQLHVELRHVAPVVWRTLLVPGSMQLGVLNHVILASMGWNHTHLHEWEIEGQRYGTLDPDGDDPTLRDDSLVSVAGVLGDTVQKFVHAYDMGDGWEHVVTVERQLPIHEGINDWPMCLAGENACPPDDVGGPAGYADFLEAIDDPDHPRHEEVWQWWGGPFDAYGFSLNDRNAALRRLAEELQRMHKTGLR